MIPSFDPALWRRASWTVFTLSLLAFICLGLAEQGSRGGGLLSPPAAPLPFERHRVFGLNLSEMSSVQARDWLQRAGTPSLALVIIPLDADVVDSLARDDRREDALRAIETLRDAAGRSPLAFCLHRPPEIVGGLGIAQAAVTSITERFPEQVVYLGACDPDAVPAWQQNINAAIRPDSDGEIVGHALIPVAGGAQLSIEHLDGLNDLNSETFNQRARGGYTVFAVDVSEPLSDDTVRNAARALSDTSHTALILLTPTGEADSAALTASFGSVILAGTELPEGFSGIGSSAIRVNDEWQRSTIGTLQYLRASSTTAALTVDFVGTDVYLSAVESPESGILNVWIDPPSLTAPPTTVLNLASFQARDSAIPIASGLPAARHQLTLQVVTEGEESIMISGFFATGKPATAWTGMFASGVVLLAGVAALTERCYTTIISIRRQTGPPRRRTRSGHPRVFARDR